LFSVQSDFDLRIIFNAASWGVDDNDGADCDIFPSLRPSSLPHPSSPSLQSYEREDDEFGDFGCKEQSDGIWCQHGKLFIDGSSSGDVVQVAHTHHSTIIVFETDSISSVKYLLPSSSAGCDAIWCFDL
jgi:hypothetical protein